MKRRSFWLAVLAICLINAASFAAVTGPTEVQLGTLATFESDIAGDAIVYPLDKGTLAKDTNGTRLYFATPEPGSYTLLFFGVRDGKAEIASHQFVVVSAPEPEPNPEPTPNPSPDPTPKPEPKPSDTLNQNERAAVKTAVSSVLEGIAAGTVRTPQGARAALKNLLIRQVGNCTTSGCHLPESVNRALRTWEAEMDIQTLDGLKEGLEKIAEELK